MSDCWNGLPPVVRLEVGEWPWERKMSEKKIVVPDGMAQAAVEATCGTRLGMAEHDALIDKALEAALRWLSENPIVPTDHECCGEMHRTVNAKGYCCYQSALLAEWQRRMFLAPEPEVPEAIKDLLAATEGIGLGSGKQHNDAVIEAYKRGREGK